MWLLKLGMASCYKLKGCRKVRPCRQRIEQTRARLNIALKDSGKERAWNEEDEDGGSESKIVAVDGPLCDCAACFSCRGQKAWLSGWVL